jgi:putative tricarboxylic transport membrane protein
MKLHDGLIAALLIAVAVAILLHVRDFPPMPGQTFGPALFPTLIAVGLIMSGVLLAVGSLRSGRRQPVIELDAWMRSPRLLFDFSLAVGAVLFYIAFSEALGYAIAAPIALFAFLIATGTRLIAAVPVALLVPLLIHYIFYTLLKVPLPWGLLVDYAW